MSRIYKTQKPRDLRKMSSEDLKKRLQDIGATQHILRGRMEAGGGINPGQWRNIKKEKARILTILAERKNPGKGGFRKR